MSMVLQRTKALAAASLTLILLSSEALAGGGCYAAFSSFLQERFPGSATLSNGLCQTCHVSAGGGNNFNTYGNAMLDAGARGMGENCAPLSNVTFRDVLVAINPVLDGNVPDPNGPDSDGEGSSNAEELAAGTQPGWCNTNGCTNPAGTPPSVDLDPPAPSPPPTANQPPTANAGGPYSGVAGETAVVFDGSLSSDPDDDPLEYAWDFGNGDTGTGVAPTYVYPMAGLYTATLVVSDASSSSDPATAAVEISEPAVNLPPVADPGGPYTGEPGVAVAFDGSRSSDPNGDALTYFWEFGDGATATDVSPGHTYDTAAEYTVSLTVTDTAGLESLIATTTATIAEASDAPPPDDSLYATYCVGCHADPWNGPALDDALAGKRRVAGARACNIEGSIFGTSVFPDGAPGMQFLQMLTDEDIQSLADYLNSEPTSGERRYVTTCAGCHGDSGEGGRVGEDVSGDSAHETWEAIREESEMRYLSCMPEDDINAIADYLAGYDDDYDDDGISDDEDDDDDNDGVSDEDEYEDGTDPRDRDSDDDGLDDGEEREHGCDPNDPDTDDDGRSDGAEVHTLGTNPLVADNFDTQSSSGGGAPGVPMLLLLLVTGLARRVCRTLA